jgi:uncharacterized protein involved in tolerance to divalent cations
MKMKTLFVCMLVCTVLLLGACGKQKKLTDKSGYDQLNSIESTDEYNVSMKTNKDTYSTSLKEITVVINYEGNKDIAFGLVYEMEKLEGDTWYKIPFDESTAFREIAIMLRSHESYEQKIAIEDLDYTFPKGRYRVIKNFYLDGKQIDVGTEFEIVDE